ncbi:MAG: 2-polyprenylphenol 6-hydroxylase [Sandaracinaceae bacterium]|nr:2-polyprenylphenol 6-hydroxylase [Sandaracinaceae bacterium]
MTSILSTVRDLARLREIVTVLVKHGFGAVVAQLGLSSLAPTTESTDKGGRGERVRKVIEELGPTFVKLGQVLSTRPDIIPEDVLAEIKKLQSDVPPVPFAAIQEQVEAELGVPLEEAFESFEEAPLAAASVGQVHRAKLKTPEGVVDVAVKVQRPGIASKIERDVELLYWLARLIERSMPEAAHYAPVKVVGEFDRALSAELDFRTEAENAKRFAAHFEHEPRVVFPRVYDARSSRRVLTLQFIDGYGLDRAIALGYDREAVVKRTIDIIIQMVFEDGFFHADPHPGNFIILGDKEDPTIAVIDLGFVGRLTPAMRDKTIDLVVAAVRNDPRALADALYAIGRTRHQKIDRAAFEAEVTVLADKYLGRSLANIDVSALVRDFMYGAQKYGLEIPSDFILVGKAAVTLDGLGKEVMPDLDLFEAFKPHALRLLRARYSPERMGQDALRNVSQLSQFAGELPVQVQEILDDLRTGRLRLETRDPTTREDAWVLARAQYAGLVVAGLFGLAGLALVADQIEVAIAAGSLAVARAIGHHVLSFVRARRAPET